MLNKWKYIALLTVFLSTTVLAERVVLDSSKNIDPKDIEQINRILAEQTFWENLFLNQPGIIVTPYYDEFGRWGAKVVSDGSRPYYVDPYYEDAMTTNRHSDEANTSTNWRMVVW